MLLLLFFTLFDKKHRNTKSAAKQEILTDKNFDKINYKHFI